MHSINIDITLRKCWDANIPGYTDYIDIFGKDWLISEYGKKFVLAKESEL